MKILKDPQSGNLGAPRWARRRYLAVDPANRLVADALEADWNTALRVLTQAQEDCDQASKNDTGQLTGAQQARIRQLATDLPAIWDDPATPARERKRIAQLLLTHFTVTRTRDTITAHVRLPAGQHHTLTTPVPPTAAQMRKTPAAARAGKHARESLAMAKDSLDRGNSALEQCTFAEFIVSDAFDRHIRRMRSVYHRRGDDLENRHSGKRQDLRLAGIPAGVHALIYLPSHGPTEQQMLSRATKQSIALHTLGPYWRSPSPSGPQAIIVFYGTPAGHTYQPAMNALTRLLAQASQAGRT